MCRVPLCVDIGKYSFIRCFVRALNPANATRRSCSEAWSMGSTYSLTTHRPSDLMCRNRHFKEPAEAVGDYESEDLNGTTVQFFQSPLQKSWVLSFHVTSGGTST